MKYSEHRYLKIAFTVLGIFLLSSLSEAQSLGSHYFSSYQQSNLILEKGIKLKPALLRIEKRFDIVFLYRTDAVKNKKVTRTRSLNEVNFENTLKKLLAEQGLILKYINPKTYGIYTKSSKKTTEQQNPVDEKVSGTVTDGQSGETLPGVNILVKGTTTGTSTDSIGHYELNVSSLQDTLRFSYIGYQKQLIPINGRHKIDVALTPQALTGEELVVVGYGTQRESDLTGSVSQVQASALEDKPVSTVTEALQGAAANLTIQQPSGAPGAGMNIDIRGISTMNNNDPLVVIDGVVGGNLDDVNPNNIKNISVLKDAGSAAIYGSRAANGVILVTTKSGQKNTRPTVTFSSQTGMNVPNIPYRPVKGYENAILKNEALVNAGNSPIYTPEDIRTLKEKGDIQWYMDTIFQKALQQNYNVAVSGGDDVTTYHVSTRYFDQQNNFVGDYGLKRYNLDLNLNTEFSGVDVKSKLSFQRSDITNPAANQGFLIADAKRTPPYYNYQMQADNGKYLINDVLSQFNPLGELEKGGYSESTNDVVTGLLQVGYDILPQLQARASFSAVINSNESLLKVNEVKYYASPDAVNYASTSGSDRNTNNDNYRAIRINPKFVLNYEGSIGTKHDISALLGVSNESFTSESNGIHMMYTDPDLNIPISETEIQNSSYTTLQTKTKNSLYSAFGRAKYSYDQKYYFEFDFRYDGSSKFAKANRWGFFPSASVGWKISEESFMGDYKNNVGDLKLRASYGTLGNQSVGNYQYQTTYFTFSNAYAFNNSAVSGTGFVFANHDIRWEQTTTLNLGLDASFFNHRLRASIDAYQKVTSDILITPTVPGTYGGGVPDYNAGSMRNRGWEVSLTYNTSTGNFNHSIRLNVADSWNTVTDFVGREQISSVDDMQRIIREGVAFNSYYGYKTDGYFQNEQEVKNGPKPIGISVQPGDLRFKDRNGDGVIDENDRYVLGNAFPRYTFGLQYDLRWKNFDLNLFLQGVGKRTMFLRGENVEPFHANYSYTMYTHQTDFWTPTNPDARWPRLTIPGSASNTNNYHLTSDLNAFDASYIKLKDIKVGYTLPKSISLGAKKVYLYVNARNLFTISKMNFLNPESTEFNNDMNNNGSNSGRSYPSIKYYGFGVQLSI